MKGVDLGFIFKYLGEDVFQTEELEIHIDETGKVPLEKKEKIIEEFKKLITPPPAPQNGGGGGEGESDDKEKPGSSSSPGEPTDKKGEPSKGKPANTKPVDTKPVDSDILKEIQEAERQIKKAKVIEKKEKGESATSKLEEAPTAEGMDNTSFDAAFADAGMDGESDLTVIKKFIKSTTTTRSKKLRLHPRNAFKKTFYNMSAALKQKKNRLITTTPVFVIDRKNGYYHDRGALLSGFIKVLESMPDVEWYTSDKLLNNYRYKNKKNVRGNLEDVLDKNPNVHSNMKVILVGDGCLVGVGMGMSRYEELTKKYKSVNWLFRYRKGGDCGCASHVKTARRYIKMHYDISETYKLKNLKI